MLRLPEPPTDNLYKFLAVLGVTLMLASGISLVGYRDWEWERLDSIGALAFRLEDSTRAIAEAMESRRGTLQEWGNRASAAKTLAYQLARETGRVSEEVDRRRWVGYASIGGVFVGFSLAVVGFRLWYVRLQRYQDAIVRAQAAERTAPPVPTKPDTAPRPPGGRRGGRRSGRR